MKTENTLEDLIETLLNTRDLCGNEAEAMRDWEADYHKLHPAQREFVRAAVNSRWNYWRKAAGVKRELWTAATQSLAMLEQHDAATADAIRKEFKSALKGAR